MTELEQYRMRLKGKFPTIATASEMSNLVGMYAFLVQDDKIKAKVFIVGKADNKYFICQAISPIDGSANVAKLMTLDELKEWVILPSQKIANEVSQDYYRNGWRYSFPFEKVEEEE